MCCIITCILLVRVEYPRHNSRQTNRRAIDYRIRYRQLQTNVPQNHHRKSSERIEFLRQTKFVPPDPEPISYDDNHQFDHANRSDTAPNLQVYVWKKWNLLSEFHDLSYSRILFVQGFPHAIRQFLELRAFRITERIVIACRCLKPLRYTKLNDLVRIFQESPSKFLILLDVKEKVLNQTFQRSRINIHGFGNLFDIQVFSPVDGTILPIPLEIVKRYLVELEGIEPPTNCLQSNR